MLKKTWEQIADAPKKEVALPFACGVACGILLDCLQFHSPRALSSAAITIAIIGYQMNLYGNCRNKTAKIMKNKEQIQL